MGWVACGCVVVVVLSQRLASLHINNIKSPLRQDRTEIEKSLLNPCKNFSEISPRSRLSRRDWRDLGELTEISARFQ